MTKDMKRTHSILLITLMSCAAVVACVFSYIYYSPPDLMGKAVLFFALPLQWIGAYLLGYRIYDAPGALEPNGPQFWRKYALLLGIFLYLAGFYVVLHKAS